MRLSIFGTQADDCSFVNLLAFSAKLISFSKSIQQLVTNSLRVIYLVSTILAADAIGPS